MQIEQFHRLVLEFLNQFPVPRTDGAARFSAADVTGEMPVDRFAVECPGPVEEGNQTHAIDRLPGWQVRTCQFRQRWIEVHAEHWLVTRSTGTLYALPPDCAGDANASFVQRALAAVEWCDVLRGAAIVAGEDDDRVVRQLLPFEERQQSADVLVNGLDRRGVHRIVAV